MLRGKTAPLRQVHLSRLSPVMWTLETGYPRPELAVPIEAMGEFSAPTVIVPRGEALWSDLYRVGTTGALSRVRPYGPAAFSGNGDAEGGSAVSRIATYAAFLAPFMAFAGLTLLFGSRR